MKLAEKAKVYDQIRNHIINAEKELGKPPPINLPYMPNVGDFDSIRGFYKALKDDAIKYSEWFAREKEITMVRHIFEDMGEDMSSRVRV